MSTTTKFFVVLLLAVNSCWASGCAEGLGEQQPKKEAVGAVEAVLKQLSQKTKELKTYQSRIEYRFSQPLFESETVRRGDLYYKKTEGESALRINFQTLKQDEEKEQKYIEQYIFDGVWLTHIDYQIKEVKRYQQAEPNEPIDAFDLVSGNLPILGFSRIEELEKEFEIKLVEEGKESNGFVRLKLRVRPESVYKDDYNTVEFWIDEKLGLPAKIVAVSVEEDIYEIRLVEPKVNEGIDKKIFEIKIPKGFGEEIIPLKNKGEEK